MEKRKFNNRIVATIVALATLGLVCMLIALFIENKSNVGKPIATENLSNLGKPRIIVMERTGNHWYGVSKNEELYLLACIIITEKGDSQHTVESQLLSQLLFNRLVTDPDYYYSYLYTSGYLPYYSIGASLY